MLNKIYNRNIKINLKKEKYLDLSNHVFRDIIKPI